VARPVALSAEGFGRIEVPVLLVLGDRDNLVGDPTRASRNASALPHLRVETLGSGHLMGVERADDVNALLADFLARKEQG
jgi:pimeloyl-ACP methyl ester carboxylesterase